MIEVRNITAKRLTRQGIVVSPRIDPTTYYNADIEPGKSIRLHGIHHNTPFDVTFEINGHAIYDSYNLYYVGMITKITANTITITETDNVRDGKVHRLSLYEFSWRNYDFDIDKIAARNHETMQSI
jgi:5-methylcytosine-specific restriction endonuclease McrBC GTP-binding regulatory subunit McrB